MQVRFYINRPLLLLPKTEVQRDSGNLLSQFMTRRPLKYIYIFTYGMYICDIRFCICNWPVSGPFCRSDFPLDGAL